MRTEGLDEMGQPTHGYEPPPTLDARTMDPAPTRPRVAVGGSLHGKVLQVPIDSKIIYADHGVSVEIVDPEVEGALTFRAAMRFTLYEVRDYQRTSAGNIGLVIASELLKSAGAPARGNGLTETIVEALAIAAGVHGVSGALTRQLVDVEAVRRAGGYGPGTE